MDFKCCDSGLLSQIGNGTALIGDLERVLEDSDFCNDDLYGHSIEELAVLGVEFPPWYYSTHGLSRPASPELTDITRCDM